MIVPKQNFSGAVLTIEFAHPEEIATLFVKAWNSNDAKAIASLFEEEAEFVNVTGLWWHNRKSILEAHAYGFETIFHDAAARIIRTKTKWVTGSVVVVHAKMEIAGQTPWGDITQMGKRQNIFSFVMKKMSKGWICVSAHNTDIIPGMETVIKDERAVPDMFITGSNPHNADSRLKSASAWKVAKKGNRFLPLPISGYQYIIY